MTAVPRISDREVGRMRQARLVVGGAAIVIVGAALGFVAALLRPRRYADFSGTHP